MAEDIEYPKEIWDYLGDMAYMPSRQDREQLSKLGDQKHVAIWDYFFQINSNDVGEPQKREINRINERLREEIGRYNDRQNQIRNSIKTHRRTLFWKRVRSFLFGIGAMGISGIIYKYVGNYQFALNLIAVCLSVPLLCAMIFWVSIPFVGRNERNRIKDLKKEIVRLGNAHNQLVKKEVNRKRTLDAEIETLKRQIPPPPSGETIRSWLNDDLKNMQDHVIDLTALGTRLVDCSSGIFDEDGNRVLQQNPIPVLGPAELQNPQKIPPPFSQEVNSDLNKHLHARRSYLMGYDRIDVLYGVYYLEYILIGNDMLATCGLFFDFINGKTYSEQITEQYYEDVVAIAIAKEFRKIVLNKDAKEIVLVEDAPTFTLSLASGEQRTVTFVSEKYFMEIRDKIDVAQDDISKIFWIRNAKETADDAMSTLRYYVRLHKWTIEDE